MAAALLSVNARSPWSRMPLYLLAFNDEWVPDLCWRSFAVVDVSDDADARYWAGRIAVAVGRPQEVHRFPRRLRLSTDTQSEALA